MEFIEYNNAKLYYQKNGVGAEVFVFFHGYGQDGNVFKPFIETFDPSKHTVYLIDIFFHGKSEWNNEHSLNNDFWLKIFLRFVEQNELKNYTLLGYSLGAKFALATYEAMPTRVKYLYLIAPDGLNYSFWYSLLTANKLTLACFKLILSNWSKFKKVLLLVSYLGFVSKPLKSFVEKSLNTIDKRKMIFDIWSMFRHLTINVTELSQQIRKHYTLMEIYIGSKDEIVQKKSLQKFLSKSKRYELIELEANHQSILKLALNELVLKCAFSNELDK